MYMYIYLYISYTLDNYGEIKKYKCTLKTFMWSHRIRYRVNIGNNQWPYVSESLQDLASRYQILLGELSAKPSHLVQSWGNFGKLAHISANIIWYQAISLKAVAIPYSCEFIIDMAHTWPVALWVSLNRAYLC